MVSTASAVRWKSWRPWQKIQIHWKDASFNYELVIFAEEEGSGFGSTMTGSKFITGIYAEADLDKLVSDTGMSLRQTLQSLSPYGPDGKNDRLQHRRFVSGSTAKRSLGF